MGFVVFQPLWGGTTNNSIFYMDSEGRCLLTNESHNIATNPKTHLSFRKSLLLLAQGQTQGSGPRMHQQALTIGTFSNTYEVTAVSPEVAMGGLQDRDV